MWLGGRRFGGGGLPSLQRSMEVASETGGFLCYVSKNMALPHAHNTTHNL